MNIQEFLRIAVGKKIVDGRFENGEMMKPFPTHDRMFLTLDDGIEYEIDAFVVSLGSQHNVYGKLAAWITDRPSTT